MYFNINMLEEDLGDKLENYNLGIFHFSSFHVLGK